MLSQKQLVIVVGFAAVIGLVAAVLAAEKWLARRPGRAAPAGPLGEVAGREEPPRAPEPPTAGPLEEIYRPDAVTAQDARSRARWVRELAAVAPVRHPNLLRVIRVFDDAADPRALVERFESRTLEEVFREGPLPPETATAYGLQAADALAALDARGVVHGAIAPWDLLVSAEGELKVRSMPRLWMWERGVARQGTPEYSSPERVADRELDGRADVYSLGAVLYEALAGAPPFAGDRPSEVMRRILQERPRPLRELRPEVSKTLDELVLRTLEKDPALRPSAAELANALRVLVPGLDMAPNALVGRRLRKYRVTAYVRRDATGFRYRVRHEESERPFTLTLVGSALREALGDELFARFKDAAKIDHPGLERVVDGFESFLVTETCDWPTLDEAWDRAPWPAERAARLGVEVCEALECLHEQHCLHCGLTPRTIRVSPEGAVKLEDWLLRRAGVRRVLEHDPRELPYLCPDHFQARAVDPDGAGLYALGATLFELLAGARPGANPRPSSISRGVPPALDEIVARALEPDPARRYRLPSVMGSALRAFLARH